ncbi:hypothetical protein EDB89DRAFT_1998878 [Lactarius sanguifluus]|nr:hypothetical protein EDB89DRAFT_1998878 [Lactarius sanguifluus]
MTVVIVVAPHRCHCRRCGGCHCRRGCLVAVAVAIASWLPPAARHRRRHHLEVRTSGGDVQIVGQAGFLKTSFACARKTGDVIWNDCEEDPMTRSGGGGRVGLMLSHADESNSNGMKVGTHGRSTTMAFCRYGASWASGDHRRNHWRQLVPRLLQRAPSRWWRNIWRQSRHGHGVDSLRQGRVQSDK